MFNPLRKKNPKAASSKRSRRTLGRQLHYEALESRELLAVVTLQDFGVSENTGEKPQSKVWEHDGQWWAAMPKSDGTWIWKLNGTSWTPTLRISTDDAFHVDVKSQGDVAHLLLFDGNSNTHLASIEYVGGGYQMWSLRPNLVSVPLGSSVETATIDLDSTGRLWVGYDRSSTVEVRYADGVYSSWSAPITVATGISSDDISVITAMPNNTLGVFWSNQSSDRFGFRYHVDGDSPSNWSVTEIPSQQTADNNMADDHVNVAVASDGTLYAAVKTSYNSSSRPAMALLVRRPNGVWENMYGVDNGGTRPIVVLNEAARKLIVAFTTSEGGGDIAYRESSMDTISFGPRQTLISGNVNNVTSTKQNFADSVVIMASSGSNVKSSLFSFDTINPNQAPVVDAGGSQNLPFGAMAILNGTVSDDGLPTPATLTTAWSRVSGPGSVTFADASSVDTTATFSAAGVYVLRLTASDGQRTTTDDVTITVAAPSPTNTAPTVDAGPNRTVTFGSPALLDGTATDDGLPSPGALSVLWSLIDGPGTVTFSNASSIDTSAQFSAPGSYTLRLSASDGSLQSFDEMTVLVNPTLPPDPEPTENVPVDVDFQDGIYPSIAYDGTRDTYITSGSAGTNFGTAPVISLDNYPNDIAALLRWDISSIPTGSVIVSAAIELNVTSDSADSYQLYALDRAWDELSATWSQSASGSGWGASGATASSDRNSTVLGTLNPSSTGNYRLSLNTAGMAAVQAWIDDPTSNFGLILQNYTDPPAESSSSNDRRNPRGGRDSTPTINDSGSIAFSSSEATSAATRPKLSLAYLPPVIVGPINLPPIVNAGNDQAIALPNGVLLQGTVTDDGLPGDPGAVTVSWTKVLGPGTVTFANASATSTTANFSAPGTYILRLTADDGNAQASDEVTIHVEAQNMAPVVNAGPNRTQILGQGVSLAGTVSDDGLPSTGSLAISWTKVSGPGNVSFTAPTAANTSATFDAPGTYTLRLTASDGALTASDEVTVEITLPVNSPPVVEAGASATISIASTLSLHGSVTDDGLPSSGTLTSLWSASGPGTVTFADPSSPVTTATFSAPGVYQLELRATDGEYQAYDTVTINVSPPVNQSPSVDAGPNRTITLGGVASLDGTVADDGLPAEGSLTVTWMKVSGPGNVTFANPAAVDTTASFTLAGTYTLRLTASDGDATVSDTVTVVVNPPNQAPTVDAGADQTIRLPIGASLAGIVGDDGLPGPPHVISSQWSKISGPGNVSFGAASSPSTTATFSMAGTYVLRLTSSDGALSSNDEVTITVLPPINLPPVVDAGNNVSITLGQSLSLSPTVTDDGLPGGSLLLTWTLTSGPAPVSFGNSQAASTTVEFTTAGTYVLRLTASDGSLVSFDELTVTVSDPPSDGPTDRRNPRRR